MCGITGFFGSFNQGLLYEMSEPIVHLGPDGDLLNCGNQNVLESP